MNRRNFLRTLGIGAVSFPVIGLLPEKPRYTIWSGEMGPMGEVHWSPRRTNPEIFTTVTPYSPIHPELSKLEWENMYYGIEHSIELPADKKERELLLRYNREKLIDHCLRTSQKRRIKCH